ncbi:DUF1439 domain-containing protein [Marinobacteraceae bacterium S3BR75-40.1]
MNNDVLQDVSSFLNDTLRRVSRRLSYTITLTEKELEGHLEQKLPWTGSFGLWRVTFSHPRLHLLPGNRATLSLKLRVGLGERLAVPGSTHLRGRLNYERQSGGFYIEKLKIDTLEVAQLGFPLQPLRIALTQGLRLWLSRHPIWHFRPDQAQHNMARAILDKVDTQPGVLRIRFRLRNLAR